MRLAMEPSSERGSLQDCSSALAVLLLGQKQCTLLNCLALGKAMAGRVRPATLYLWSWGA
eukprot:260047-Prorocentrum_lima.AAC.1